MSTKINKLRVEWTAGENAYSGVFSSKRALNKRVKDTFGNAGLDTAQDAVKTLKEIHAKIKAAGLVWQDQTAKKTTKRASRASSRRYEHHARNELMKNLEKSSGAPRGGEAIEMAVAKELKGKTRKAAKARRVARKIMPSVEMAVKKSFVSPADKAAQLASLREAKLIKSEKIEVLGDLEDKVAGVICYGTKPVVYTELHVELINDRELTFRCESPVELAPIVDAAAANFAEAERNAKAKRKAEREAECKPLTKAAFLLSASGRQKQTIKAERTAKAKARRLAFKASGGSKVGGPGEGVQVRNANLSLCVAGHVGTKVAA